MYTHFLFLLEKEVIGTMLRFAQAWGLDIGILGGGCVCLCRLEERGRRGLVLTVPGGS